MAIDKEIWEHIKADYEASVFKEENIFSELSRKYKVDRGGISKKAKTKGWVYGKNSHLSHLEASNIKGLSEVMEEKSHLSEKEKSAVDEKTKQLLEKENINRNSMLVINAIQQKLLDSVETMDIEGLKPREITGALKDINDINNPKDANVFNNVNAQQNNEVNKVEWEIVYPK